MAISPTGSPSGAVLGPSPGQRWPFGGLPAVELHRLADDFRPAPSPPVVCTTRSRLQLRLRLRAPGTHLAWPLRLGSRRRSTLRQRFIGYTARPHR